MVAPPARYTIRMDTRERNVFIRNVVGGVGLMLIVALVMAYCGVFEGKGSEEDQVRKLMERCQDEINEHDWDDLLRLCDLTPEETDLWQRSIPKAQADMLVIEAVTPKGLINVPGGATEYELTVSVLARLDLPLAGGLRAQTFEGKMYFVKVNGVWMLDLWKTAPTFPHITVPRRPRAP